MADRILVPHPEACARIVENKRVKDNNLLRNSNKTKIRQCGVSANIRFVVPNLKIVGGRPAARGRWPWQVAIFNEKQDVYCGGTLIAPKWVLTAAHCFRTTMYVRIGEHDLNHYEGTETDIKVSKVVVHPSYNRKTVDADIALLLLSRSVGAESKGSQTSVLGIACLPHHRQQVPVKQLCVTTGWGKSDFDDLHGTDVLHEVQVSILSSEMCQNVHLHYLITDNMFCAGNKRRPADSCTGDSGGPLLCKNRQGRWTVFGITSFGDGCGTRGKFGIYVKVAKFAKWIHSIMSRYG
ncbi:trypsin-3-like [Bacillus rossius redtenbacheri]|uniref:trypsin-3-like n=1 Tax=Bacillus rossius redtenbacheri TaxID=93214 RepID=UPI002FDE7C45